MICYPTSENQSINQIPSFFVTSRRASYACMTHKDTIAEDFARALDVDARRRAVNDAKKRGAAQRCGYDAFHQLVLGANLKPFTKGSWLEHLRDPSSASSASLSSRTRSRAVNFPSSTLTIAKASVDRSALTAPPRCVDDFSRTWRRFGDDNAAKARFLLDSIPIDAFERIFKVRRMDICVYVCARIIERRRRLSFKSTRYGTAFECFTTNVYSINAVMSVEQRMYSTP